MTQEHRMHTVIEQGLADPETEIEAISALSPWTQIRDAVSGLYVPSGPFTPHPDPAAWPPRPIPIPQAIPLPDPLRFQEEVRLDVDGRFPQMAVSGAIRPRFARALHWIARLAQTGPDAWIGAIWHKDGDASLLPYTDVEVRVTRSPSAPARRLSLTFRGGATRDVARRYVWKSASFHPVVLEYDTVQGAHPALEIDTHAHPGRPATLPKETLTIRKVFSRAGFSVSKSGADGILPLAGAGIDGRWSDTEMHDAMIVHWSHFQDAPRWSLWTLFASLHEQGTSLGGIMFDDIGPNHRQGTAIFTDSFIAQPPAGDTAPAAWVERMRFWTAVHEMGHAFNLAHAWQKALGTPWIPLPNEPEVRSFMNYPYRVSGGQAAFFADFDFRFSDAELLFLRHAPERFVQMGNADWFDHHGFENALVSPEPALGLEIRVNRPAARFQFLEPVVIELELVNRSPDPLIVDAHVLGSDALVLVLEKEGKPARRWHPFSRTCRKREARVVQPGEALYESVFAGAGVNGWDVAEPGCYRLQACLACDGEDIVSPSLELRIAPPISREEEHLAQDVLTEPVGRALAFDGTRAMGPANDALREAVERLPDRKIALHAKVALGLPLRCPGKTLECVAGQWRVVAEPAQTAEADRLLHDALLTDESAAAESLGHIDYHDYVDRYARALADDGHVAKARSALGTLHATLERRGVRPAILATIRRPDFARKPVRR